MHAYTYIHIYIYIYVYVYVYIYMWFGYFRRFLQAESPPSRHERRGPAKLWKLTVIPGWAREFHEPGFGHLDIWSFGTFGIFGHLEFGHLEFWDICLRSFCADSSFPQISAILVGHFTMENDSLRNSRRNFHKNYEFEKSTRLLWCPWCRRKEFANITGWPSCGHRIASLRSGDVKTWLE